MKPPAPKFYDIAVYLPPKNYTVEADSEQEAIDTVKHGLLGDPYFVLDGGKVSPDAVEAYSPATLVTGHDVDVDDIHSWVAACGNEGREWLEKMDVVVMGDGYEVE